MVRNWRQRKAESPDARLQVRKTTFSLAFEISRFHGGGRLTGWVSGRRVGIWAEGASLWRSLS